MALAVLVGLSTDGGARLLIGGLGVPSATIASIPKAIVIAPGDATTALNPAASIPAVYTLARLRSGAALQRNTALPILVAAGWQSPGIAASLREDFRVPVRWEDTSSRNLWQSAANSAALLRAAGISSIYLVADAPEERLAEKVFRRAGLQVMPAPVRRPNPLTLKPSVFLSFAPAWLDSSLAVLQWAGLACDAVPACVSWMLERATPGPS